MTIAIDGPVGAGKSTIARRLAQALGILYLDTGAMYRSLGLKGLREGIDLNNTDETEALCTRTEVSIRRIEGEQHTFLDGEDVTDLIRTPQVDMAASTISRGAGVRACMVALQQQYAREADCVLDGRDIGTRVLPDATFKFFLTASAETRAHRRHAELVARKGADAPAYEQVLSEVIARDQADMNRPVDPLRRAQDAWEVDTDALDIDGVVERLLQIIHGGNA